jgi:hypothetical protein
MTSRQELTPCILCEKAIIHLWPEDLIESGATNNLDSAAYMYIIAGYGSNFDMNEYQAIICDDCLDKAIQRNRVIFVKEHSFGDNN